MMRSAEYIADFGMDTITLAGPLAAKLQAIRDAGFSQVMMAARDLVGHADPSQQPHGPGRVPGTAVTQDDHQRSHADQHGIDARVHALEGHPGK